MFPLEVGLFPMKDCGVALLPIQEDELVTAVCVCVRARCLLQLQVPQLSTLDENYITLASWHRELY